MNDSASTFILSIDQGTTSSRAMLFNSEGRAVYTAQQEFTQYFPNDGWVEHDPEEIWSSVLSVTQETIDNASKLNGGIAAIGITNQRETTVVWDRESGKPLYNAIVWQDRRTAETCKQLKARDLEARVAAKTGLLLDPYFSGTKVSWILDNVEGARELAENGQLAFGTIDSFLIWRLTGGKVHATDATNASRTLLYNIHENKWDVELLDIIRVPAAMLPEVRDCAADYGACEASLFGQSIPIAGVVGDQQSALIGQACFKAGMIKSTYGTGCFLILNTGEKVITSDNKLLTTIAYRIDGKTNYAIEGSIFVGGAAVQWLRDGIGIIKSAKETESIAASVNSNNDVYLVPAFTGLGAPYWDPDARGAIFGLTRDTGVVELVRAALESVCYQTSDLLAAMENDGMKPERLRVDGGMVRNDWVCNFLSDILGIEVERPVEIETTALGAAYMAGLQVGIFQSLDEIEEKWCADKQFDPAMDETERSQLLENWHNAVDRVRTEDR